MDSPDDLRQTYRQYLDACNARDWTRVGDFVSTDVEANDAQRGRAGYVDAIRALIDAFPDFTWEIRNLVVENSLLAAHLVGRGTQQTEFLAVQPTGQPVEAPEFALYHFDAGRIVQLWSTADHFALLPELGD